MNKKRVYEILKSKEKYDVFYDNRPVWIQEVENNNIAKVGFIDGPDEKDVYLKDLYEFLQEAEGPTDEYNHKIDKAKSLSIYFNNSIAFCSCVSLSFGITRAFSYSLGSSTSILGSIPILFILL